MVRITLNGKLQRLSCDVRRLTIPQYMQQQRSIWTSIKALLVCPQSEHICTASVCVFLTQGANQRHSMLYQVYAKFRTGMIAI